MINETNQSDKSNNKKSLEDIFTNYSNAHRDKLIPILQEIQEKEGYISRESVVKIGQHLQLPSSKIYGVATFYNQFRFQPAGTYHIQICRGTACHVKGSEAILKSLNQALKIEPGQTTRDGLFSLEVVACIGACGLAPVISINGEFYGNLTADDIPKILKEYRNKGKKNENK